MNREQDRPEAHATDTAALGPAPLGAPRHGVWAGCSFLPDTLRSEYCKNGE